MKKSKIIAYIVLVIMTFSLLGIYLISSKYDDVKILSLRKEYNLIINDENETVDIPLYFSRTNSFLTDINSIKNIYLTNDTYKLKTAPISLKVSDKIKYLDSIYYGYILTLSFSSYDDYEEPIFISNCLLEIDYENDDEVNLKIGNISLYINTNYINNDDIVITKLEALTTYTDNIETIIGINIRIYNIGSSNIYLNKIEIKNKYYELDYMKYTVGFKDDPSDVSFISDYLEEGELSIKLIPQSYIDCFIPIVYLAKARYVDRFGLYLSYTKNNKQLLMIQDDFTFMKKSYFLGNDGIEQYEYQYFKSK